MIKFKNKLGVLMVVVLIIVMIMMIASVTIISQSMSQTRGSRVQADQIVAEQLAKGVFWQDYNNGTFPTCGPFNDFYKHTYTCTTNYNAGSGAVIVTVTY